MTGKVKILDLLFIIIIFFIINSNSASASYLNASKYEIKLKIDYPREVISDSININTGFETENKLKKNNIYLERVVLENSSRQKIPSQYIKLETPYFNDTLDKQHRFLLMKKENEKSMFKISLLRQAAYLEPGKYEGKIYIDELDWEIDISVIVNPFVVLNLKKSKFEFEITNASRSNFFIAPDQFVLIVNSNHTDWEIEAVLKEEAFLNQQEDILSADKLYYLLERAYQKNDLNELKKKQFTSISENGMIAMINGSDYQKGLKAIRFGVDLAGDNNFVQPAGLYSGNIIFTLRTLKNNN